MEDISMVSYTFSAGAYLETWLWGRGSSELDPIFSVHNSFVFWESTPVRTEYPESDINGESIGGNLIYTKEVGMGITYEGKQPHPTPIIMA